jgi:hypothetical protein
MGFLPFRVNQEWIRHGRTLGDSFNRAADIRFPETDWVRMGERGPLNSPVARRLYARKAGLWQKEFDR